MGIFFLLSTFCYFQKILRQGWVLINYLGDLFTYSCNNSVFFGVFSSSFWKGEGSYQHLVLPNTAMEGDSSYYLYLVFYFHFNIRNFSINACLEPRNGCPSEKHGRQASTRYHGLNIYQLKQVEWRVKGIQGKEHKGTLTLNILNWKVINLTQEEC